MFSKTLSSHNTTWAKHCHRRQQGLVYFLFGMPNFSFGIPSAKQRIGTRGWEFRVVPSFKNKIYPGVLENTSIYEYSESESDDLAWIEIAPPALTKSNPLGIDLLQDKQWTCERGTRIVTLSYAMGV